LYADVALDIADAHVLAISAAQQHDAAQDWRHLKMKIVCSLCCFNVSGCL
jgi:hypothetical protein